MGVFYTAIAVSALSSRTVVWETVNNMKLTCMQLWLRLSKVTSDRTEQNETASLGATGLGGMVLHQGDNIVQGTISVTPPMLPESASKAKAREMGSAQQYGTPSIS